VACVRNRLNIGSQWANICAILYWLTTSTWFNATNATKNLPRKKTWTRTERLFTACWTSCEINLGYHRRNLGSYKGLGELNFKRKLNVYIKYRTGLRPFKFFWEFFPVYAYVAVHIFLSQQSKCKPLNVYCIRLFMCTYHQKLNWFVRIWIVQAFSFILAEIPCSTYVIWRLLYIRFVVFNHTKHSIYDKKTNTVEFVTLMKFAYVYKLVEHNVVSYSWERKDSR